VKETELGGSRIVSAVGVLMKSAFRLLAASVLLTSVGFCQTAEETTELEHQKFETNLASGSNLRLHLHDGDFRVVGCDSNKISVHVEARALTRRRISRFS